jgi:selenocysteine lyase/cysteine desulfurase
MQRTFDVRAVREQFPALGRKHTGRQVVYLDGPGGSQMVVREISARAQARTLTEEKLDEHTV